MKKFVLALLCFILMTFSVTGCNIIDIDELITSNGYSNENNVSEDVNLNVHFIDVGQADCILIESNNQYMLVDAGNNADEDLILNYLDNLGVKRLEYVIGTHPHEDHIGSLDAVIRNYDIGKLILPEKEHTTKTFENVIDAIEEKNLKITKPKVGDEYQIGDANFIVIAPNGDYKDELNDWSVGIKLSLEDTSFVLCGDAERDAENDILSNGIDISADVLKLGHHGSRTSSSKEFVDAVNPSFIVITCGMDNSYGHPHKETMKWLKSRGIPFFRTDMQGTIIASSNGVDITWNVEPSQSYESGSK